MSQECPQPSNLNKRLWEERCPPCPRTWRTVASSPTWGGNTSTLSSGRYWRLFNDHGFSPPVANTEHLVVFVEAFFGLTH
ncbi:hypothetical protein GW17_00016951 [Ensete ventricosum]|nr:hypothetical protein GW17_00016951 [Ensete ventricosum]